MYQELEFVGSSHLAEPLVQLKCLCIENFEIYLFAFYNATLCSDYHVTN